MVAVTQGFDGGLDDVRGRLEVGLTDAEIDDVPPRSRQRLGAREHLEGGLRAELGHTLRGLDHGRIGASMASQEI